MGIVLLARYREARHKGPGVEDALAVGIWGSRLGTLAAAFAAAASYASLMLTEFRGFRQFGYIGGAGLVASWVMAFVLDAAAAEVGGPPGRGRGCVAPRGAGAGIMGRVVAVIERWPVPIVAVAAAADGRRRSAVSRFDVSTQLEHDFSKLRRSDTWVNGDGYWGRRVDACWGATSTPTVVLTDAPQAAAAANAHARGRGRPRAPARHGRVGAQEPTTSCRRTSRPRWRWSTQIRDALTPKIRSLIDPGRRKKLDDLLGPEDLRPARRPGTCPGR